MDCRNQDLVLFRAEGIIEIKQNITEQMTVKLGVCRVGGVFVYKPEK